MTTPILELREVNYDYRTDFLRQKKRGLRNVSLVVHAGEAFGFLGPNGAGKTTTMKCLLDFIRPTSGAAFIRGIPVRKPEARTSVGYIAEQPYFYDYLSVGETVELYATLAGLRGAERTTRVASAIERVGLGARRASKLRSLSKGLTQRVALAQAIVAEPQLLLLDEPFSGLDPIGRAEFREIFLGLKQTGTTLFISSHILHDVEQLCDRASIMVQGEIKALVTMKDLSLQPVGYRIDATIEAAPLAETSPTLRKISHPHGVTFETTVRHEAEQILTKIPPQSLIRFDPIRPTLQDVFQKTIAGVR